MAYLLWPIYWNLFLLCTISSAYSLNPSPSSTLLSTWHIHSRSSGFHPSLFLCYYFCQIKVEPLQERRYILINHCKMTKETSNYFQSLLLDILVWVHIHLLSQYINVVMGNTFDYLAHGCDRYLQPKLHYLFFSSKKYLVYLYTQALTITIGL